jgi:uncharacterized lipoprotein YbaY
MAENNDLVTGEITFEDGTQPFSGATAFVKLEDVSLMDVDATVVAQQTLQNVAYDGFAAIPFVLNGSADDEKARYRVSAHISFDGDEDIQQGDFVTMQSYPVLTYGNPNTVTLQVRRV